VPVRRGDREAGHELTPEGDDSARAASARLPCGQPAQDARDPRRWQVQEGDVVFAQIGPLGVRIGEGLFDPGSEPARGPQVGAQAQHPDTVFEAGTVHTAFLVDDDQHPLGNEPFLLDEHPNRRSGEARTHVREHDRGHFLWDTRRSSKLGRRFKAQLSSHSAGT
jgi:hypothetical protein